MKFSHKEPFFNFSKEDFKKDFISNSTEYLEDYILEAWASSVEPVTEDSLEVA